MNLPIELKAYIESLADSYKISDLKETANKLSNKYLNESGKGYSLANKDIDIVTYTIMRMPATFASCSNVLMSLENYFNDINFVLDVGSGIGTATIASSYLFNNVKEYTLIEREPSMIKFGKKIMMNVPNLTNVNYIEDDYIKYNFNNNYDLVIASYSLNELSEIDRKEMIDKLWNITNKFLVIVEPGTPVGSKEIREIRDYLLNNKGYILAPCPHEQTCPIKDNDWCHFVTRVERSKLHKLLKDASSPFEDEKYSYLVMAKKAITKSYSYRILRHPIINKNNVCLVTCSNEGIETKQIFKNAPLYKFAKKAKCGDSY